MRVEKPKSQHVNDCAWMAKRKAEWLLIERRLPCIAVRRNQWPFLKAHFLPGSHFPNVDLLLIPRSGGTSYTHCTG